MDDPWPDELGGVLFEIAQPVPDVVGGLLPEPIFDGAGEYPPFSTRKGFDGGGDGFFAMCVHLSSKSSMVL